MRSLERKVHGRVFGEPRLGPGLAGPAARSIAIRRTGASRQATLRNTLDQLASIAAGLDRRDGIDVLLKLLMTANDLARRLGVGPHCGSALLGASPDAVLRKKRLQSIASRLSPRERQTLQLLLKGRSEKEIAMELELSAHTVHEFTKTLHARFQVARRSELLALWIVADV